MARRHSETARLAFLSTGPCLAPLGSMTLDEDDVEVAQSWLEDRSTWADCDLVSKYETEFARWNGSRYAFAFMGGRVALSAAIYALDLHPGDEVILPAYTCVVVPNAFAYAGVQAIYSDIELSTYGLDADQVEKRITSRTRAILLQHVYGLVCRDYDALLGLAKRRGLNVIEDCAHATGATYHGVKVGNRGDIGFYSSEQSKVFNTTQGGMVVTNSPHLGQRLREYYQRAKEPDVNRTRQLLETVLLNYYQGKHRYRNPTLTWSARWAVLRYRHRRVMSTTPEEMRGIRPSDYGARMPAPIAALGLNQLRKIDYYNKIRRHAAQKWNVWADSNGYLPALPIEYSVPVYLRYPLLVEPEKKTDASWAAQELGIELGVWFVSQTHPVPITIAGCPNSEIAVNRCVNLPTIP